MLDWYIKQSLKRSMLDSGKSYDFSSTQINLPPFLSAQIIAWGKSMIADEQLAADGRELESHVTVKYGLLTSDPQDVLKVVGGFGPVEVELGRTFKFEKPEYDVLCIEVVGGKRLLQLNELVTKSIKSLPNEDMHPQYIPHVTIAYVGKGLIPDEALNSPAFEGVFFVADTLQFNRRNVDEVSQLPLKTIDLSGQRTGDEQFAVVLRALQGAGLAPHHSTKWDRRKRSFTRTLAYTEQSDALRAMDWLNQQGIEAGRVLKAGDGQTWYYTIQASSDTYTPRGAAANNEVGRMFGKSAVMGYTDSATLRELLVNKDWLSGSALWRTRQGIPIYDVEQGLGSILIFDGVRWWEYPGDETIYADVKAIKGYADPLPRTLEDLARRKIRPNETGGILTIRDYPQLEQLHPHVDYEGEEFTAMRKQVDQLDQVTFARKKEFWKAFADEVAQALVEIKGGFLSLPMREVFKKYIQHGRPWENVELDWRGKKIERVESLGGIFRALLEDGRWASIGGDDEIDVMAYA